MCIHQRTSRFRSFGPGLDDSIFLVRAGRERIDRRCVVFWQSPTFQTSLPPACAPYESSETGPEAPLARLIIDQVAIPMSHASTATRGHWAWSGQRGCGNSGVSHGGSKGEQDEVPCLTYVTRSREVAMYVIQQPEPSPISGVDAVHIVKIKASSHRQPSWLSTGRLGAGDRPSRRAGPIVVPMHDGGFEPGSRPPVHTSNMLLMSAIRAPLGPVNRSSRHEIHERRDLVVWDPVHPTRPIRSAHATSVSAAWEVLSVNASNTSHVGMECVARVARVAPHAPGIPMTHISSDAPDTSMGCQSPISPMASNGSEARDV